MVIAYEYLAGGVDVNEVVGLCCVCMCVLLCVHVRAAVCACACMLCMLHVCVSCTVGDKKSFEFRSIVRP